MENEIQYLVDDEKSQKLRALALERWASEQKASAEINARAWIKAQVQLKEEDRLYSDAELECVLPPLVEKRVRITICANGAVLDGVVQRVTRHHLKILVDGKNVYVPWDVPCYIEEVSGEAPK